MSYTDTPTPSVGSAIAGVASMGIGYYLGISFFIPLVIALVAYFLLRKFVRRDPTALGVCAVLIGHGATFLLAAAVAPQLIATVGLDLVLIAAFLIWFLWSTTRPPAIAIIAYEAIGLAINLYVATQFVFDSAQFKGILVNIVLRLLVIGLGVSFILKFKERQESPENLEEIFRAE
jgi:hypothetical protein